ncbi:MAG: HIT family protein [Promethearchaeota archaeon]
MSEDCIFCKIIAGKIPCYKVFESEHTLAFLDIGPMVAGHTVVIPKKHFFTFEDMPSEELQPFFADLQKVCKILKEKLNADGYNIVQNNYRAAGQLVEHAHYHILPRTIGDGISLVKKTPEFATDEEIKKTFAKLQ